MPLFCKTDGEVDNAYNFTVFDGVRKFLGDLQNVHFC